jgi:predicted metalloprotease with PDZ domain
MLSLIDLSEQVAACRDGRLSLDDFEDWFRTHSKGSYAHSEVTAAAAAIEAAFSKQLFQEMNDEDLREELALALRPGALSAQKTAPQKIPTGFSLHSISSKWIVLEGIQGCIVPEAPKSGNSATIMPPSACEGYPFWHFENSTRTLDHSLRPV